MREYARIRGVNLNAVQTAVKSGRIHKTKDDKIAEIDIGLNRVLEGTYSYPVISSNKKLIFKKVV